MGDDLTKEGYIYCDYHGDIEGHRHDKSKGPPLSASEKRRQEINKFIKEYGIKFLFGLAWPGLLVIIAIDILKH